MPKSQQIRTRVPPSVAVLACHPAVMPSLTRGLVHAGLVIRARVSTRDKLVRCLAGELPDVLLLDARLETRHGGIDLLSRLESEGLATILIAQDVDAELLERTERAGAAGFLVWPTTQPQLEATLATALGARRVRPPPPHEQLRKATATLQRIARELASVGHLVCPPTSGPRLRQLAELASLSSREWEVLRGLVDHKRVPQLAKDMHISPHTVRNHLKAIFVKLGVHSQSELLARVVERRSDERTLASDAEVASGDAGRRDGRSACGHGSG